LDKFCEAGQLRIFLQLNGFVLIIMRRDIFQAIADPTRRAILVLIAVQAMTPNAIAEHFDVTPMKEVDIWLDRFRKIMVEKFQQLDEVLYTLKNKKNEPVL
jgi:hypothetical protein